MRKNIHINIEETIKEENRRRKARAGGTTHQMVPGIDGQFVDAYFNMDTPQLSEAALDSIGRGQVETLLVLQTDSDTLRVIENVESENEVLDRIMWGKKKKKKKVIY